MNTGIVKTYDAKYCSITFGEVIVEDFADGDFITISGQGENFEAVQGADGSENRINKNITGIDVTVTVSQMSRSNTLLSALYLADKITNKGFRPFLFKDLAGDSFCSSAFAYIKGMADLNDGNAPTTRAWSFRLPNASYNVGGNL